VVKIVFTGRAIDREKQAMSGKEYSMELLFKAFANRTRLRVINLIGDDEVCVCFFVEVLNTNQPKISRHLAYLRRAGLVSTRREGKWMHYRLVEPPDAHAAKMFREIRVWLANNAEMQRDKTRLAKLCCAPQLPLQLQRAPRPASLVA
jgi:ArsR family transcriptional regulator, arsenate/arsenite/antimonite-responsive transcriptional repressor